MMHEIHSLETAIMGASAATWFPPSNKMPEARNEGAPTLIQEDEELTCVRFT
jgi:hypothetical protein